MCTSMVSPPPPPPLRDFRHRHFRTFYWIAKASSTWDMGAINNGAVCRNSGPMCYMRCCMIFSSASCQRNAVRIVVATLFPYILQSCHRKVKYAQQEASLPFSGRHSHNTVASAEFLHIRKILQGFAGKSTVSKNTCRPVSGVPSVYTPVMTLDFIRPKKRPYIHCTAWIFLTSQL